MSQPPSEDQDALFAAIDAEADVPEEERAASKILYSALHADRDELGAVSEIPADDQQLSEQVRSAATKRSAEIRASQQFALSDSQATPANGDKPIPAWLWGLWVVAIIAAVVAVFLFW